MMYKGIAASPGIIIGEAHVKSESITAISDENISHSEVREQVDRLREAVSRTRAEIINLKEKVKYDIGNNEANIFNAYLLLLEDRMFSGKAEKLIVDKLIKAEYALSLVLEDYTAFFNKMSDSYLKERSRDIAGLVEKIVRNLSGQKEEPQKRGKGVKHVVVAHDLTPADTAEMDKSMVLGFVTEEGGSTSHTAIVARSLEIPAVVGVRDITRNIKSGDTVILDGEKGIVAVNPAPKVLAAYREEQKKYISKLRMLKKLKKLQAMTLDQHRIELDANIEFPEEAGPVLENNADGVGLFRTEFIFINKMNLPNEEEQFESYRSVVEKLSPKPVTIRTMDIGGDKFLPYFKLAPEQNPFLGLRSIRLSLANTNIFRNQLRAIMRASAYGKVRIMFPMVTTAEEITEAKKLLEEVKADLIRKKVKFDPNVETGIMIEVPAAAVMSNELAKHVDFFSIGTNDLIQYTMAVDRGNQAVARYYDELNPAVLRLIKMTVESAHRNNIKVSVCGEMAGAPHIAFLLIGMGVDGLSVGPASILAVKKILRSIKFQEAIEAAEKALRMENSQAIRDYVMKFLESIIYAERGARE